MVIYTCIIYTILCTKRNNRFFNIKIPNFFRLSSKEFNSILLQNLLQIQILKEFRNFLFPMEVLDSNKEFVPYGSPYTYRRKPIGHERLETELYIVKSTRGTSIVRAMQMTVYNRAIRSCRDRSFTLPIAGS